MNTNLLSASAEVLPLALVIALSPFTVVGWHIWPVGCAASLC
jgi:hypothetical protein